MVKNNYPDMENAIKQQWVQKGTYNIAFEKNEGGDWKEDCTQFYAVSTEDMIELLTVFFTENNLQPDAIRDFRLWKVSEENI